MFRVVIKPTSDGGHIVLLKSKSNGQCLMQSQTYKKERSATTLALNLVRELRLVEYEKLKV